MSSDDNLYLAGNFNTDEFVSTNEGTVISKWKNLSKSAYDLIRLGTSNNAFSVGIVSPILKSVKIKGNELLETTDFLEEFHRSFSCLLYVKFSDLTMVNRSTLWMVVNGADFNSFIGLGRDPAYPDKLCVFVKNTSTSTPTVYPTSYTIIKGVWCPIFFTYNYDTKTARCFVDNKKIYENTNLIADVMIQPPPPMSNNLFKYYKYFTFAGNIKDGDALSLKIWNIELTENQVVDITNSLSFKINRRLVSINITDSIHSIPSSGQFSYSYLQYPTIVKSKNALQGTQFADGSFYYLVLSQYGLYIVKNDNSDDIQMVWPKDANDTSYLNYSSYGLFIQTNGNLMLLGNPNKNTDGTIDGSKGTFLWSSGKAYSVDNVQRLYTLRLEGQSMVVRNKFGDIFSNSQDSSSLLPATSCVIESTNMWGPCTPNTCGTTGKLFSTSYVKTQSTYGGPCDDKDKIFERPCTNPACQPVNCTFESSNLPWSECTNKNICGTVGVRFRPYKIIEPAKYGGTCEQEKYPESELCPSVRCPSPKDCETVPITPSDPTPWSICSSSNCNFSTQQRPTHKVTVAPSWGGECPLASLNTIRLCFNSDKCNIVDSIQSLPEAGKYTLLEYPITTTGKNAIKGTPLPDGSIYFLVLNQTGLHIVNKDDIEDRVQTIWTADTQKYSAYRLGLSGKGKLTIRANLTGTIAGAGGDYVWDSGKEYTGDNIDRLYTLRLEGQSMVVRNKYNEIFYNDKDSNANQTAIGCSLKTAVSGCNPNTCGTKGIRTVSQLIVSPSKYGGPCDDKDKKYDEMCSNPECPINCVLSPSNATYSPCSTTACGTTGIRSRRKYTVTSPSMYGGTCTNENEIETTPCSAVPCPRDCILTPSNATYSPCSTTACDTTGIRSRRKYTVTSPSMYGGKCTNENEMETTPCSAVPCPRDCILTPSNATYSPCSTTACDTTGTQSRRKYTVISPSMYGGKCTNENEMESKDCSTVCPTSTPSATISPSVVPTSTPSSTISPSVVPTSTPSSTISPSVVPTPSPSLVDEDMYIIAGVVVAILLLLLLVVMLI